MPISVVFDPPLPSDSPSTFNTKAFTLLGDLNDWSTQANALPGEVATNLATLLAAPPAIGSTTPAAGSFTTLSASGGVTNTAGRSNFSSNDAYAIGAKNTGGGPVYFGATDSTASPGGHIANSGGADIISWTNAGAVTIPGSVTTNSDVAVTKTSVNGVSLAITNPSASGSYPLGKLSQYGSNGDGITSWPNAFLIEGQATGGLVLGGYVGDIVFQTGRTDRMRITNATGAVTIPGSVLIGAPSANSKVNIHDTGTNASISMTDSGVGNNYGGYVRGYGIAGVGGYLDLGVVNNNSKQACITINYLGAVSIPGATSFTGGTFGYGTGAGGTVTQATSKSTAVTLNKPCGQITMNNAALAAGDVALFQVTNSVAVAASIVLVSPNANPAGEFYSVWSSHTFAGAFFVCVKNITAGSRSEALVINFAVLSGATS